jgi:hypothetical protein
LLKSSADWAILKILFESWRNFDNCNQAFYGKLIKHFQKKYTSLISLLKSPKCRKKTLAKFIAEAKTRRKQNFHRSCLRVASGILNRLFFDLHAGGGHVIFLQGFSNSI